ncbi:hypothetical protein ACWGOQ_0002535 [Aquimarina sp. M1]
MKKQNIHTILLLICILLLSICAYGIYSQPTLDEIDQRIQYWGQHYGQHFSAINN